MKRVILFDFDGVIVDSFEAMYQVVLGMGFNVTREQEKALFNGNVFEEVDRNSRKDWTAEVERVFYETYIPRLMNLPPVEGISRVLEELGESHTLIVVSSSISSPILGYLEKHNLARHFDEIMGAELHRSKVIKINMTLEKHKIAPTQAVFITDTLGDMKEATKCGVPSIGVTWGFHEKERLQKGNPAAIIETPQDLAQNVRAIIG